MNCKLGQPDMALRTKELDSSYDLRLKRQGHDPSGLDGAHDATLLMHEILYCKFGNRHELASWAALTPTPWPSGDVQRDQGISRDGLGWIRAQLVQMA